MWAVVINNIDYSLFGYGFGGVFWGEGNPAEFLVGRLYFLLGHAHNGFIDAFIDMGFIGGIIYPIALLFPLLNSVQNYLNGKNHYAISILFLTFLTFYSLSGSSFLKQNNLLFFFYCLAVILPLWRDYSERFNNHS
jgi:O-antigen ligase